MLSLYIQSNILIAAAWIVFQLLPKEKLRYRSVKKIAQWLLISSLALAPILYALPKVAFPDFSQPVEVQATRDVDGALRVSAPARIFQQVARVAESAPQKVSGPSRIWFWVFLAGLAAMIVHRARSAHRLAKVLSRAIALHKVGSTVVGISEDTAIPFSAWHKGRAYVVLPSTLVPHREEFRIALRHEIEHHRRRDTLWAVGLEWMIAAFYLNPAIYLWRKTILNLQELACDEALIGRMGISKRAYGSCLLKVAEMALGRRFMCAGTTCMIPTSQSNSRSFLRRRISMFAKHERTKTQKAAAFAIGTVSSLSIVAGAYFAHAAVRSNTLPNAGKPVFDSRVQSLAQQSLKNGMTQHGASAGFAIVSDADSGTVMAAVSLNEGFDNNLTGDWALSYPYAPASSLKSLIVGAAIEQKVTTVDEAHDCENGHYKFGKNVYHDNMAFERLTTAEAVIHSSNICTLKVAEKLGAKGLEDSLREFGIGPGGALRDYPGARVGNVPVAGIIPEAEYIALLAYGVSNRTDFFVTPLEMVQAYGAIANGGKLMKAIVADGRQKSEVVRDVLSAQTSAQMREVLRRVVTEGTGQSIRGSAIPLAGKTSTMNLDGTKRMTGFVGYAPATHPKYVVYVALFFNDGKDKAGSNTAAPVFREIVEKTVSVSER